MSIGRKIESQDINEGTYSASRLANATRKAIGARKANPDRTPNLLTTDKDYSESELEFIQAVEDHKRKIGRKFLATSEYLGIATLMGYVRMEVGHPFD